MCGICGIYNFINREPISEGLIRAMCAVMRHRGPDDEGVYVDSGIGLGMCRLSIIDLATGHQPIRNEDGHIWIVFNGEIYNFPELRESLSKKGHVFSTASDTETILHLYEEYAQECPQHLRGMFAFALWDGRRERLFLCRDRVGKKPLYYAVLHGKLIFASEIKSILQYGGLSREMDLEALNDYLTLGYIPSPRTIFKAVRKLPPGHWLTCEKGEIKTSPYWDLTYQVDGHHRSIDDYAERLRELLEESVRVRLMSEVPLGAFLSGGIDSSTVVAYMTRLMSEPVKTFSIGFTEESYNELRYAKIVAQQLGTEHREFIVEPKAIELLPKLVWHFDEPFADSSAIPTYLVSKLSREHVTVILSGDGGDETFAGYERYPLEKEAAHIARVVPRFFRERVVPSVLDRLPSSAYSRPGVFVRKLRRYLKRVNLSPEERFTHRVTFFDGEAKEHLYADWLKGELLDTDSAAVFKPYFDRMGVQDGLNRLLYVDTKVYLPDDILVKVDRMSMAVSLETRAPLLDHKLMEFVATIPPEYKMKGFTTKYILKKAVAELLPQEIINRSKRGFRVPISAWFREDLKELTRGVLTDSHTQRRGYFEQGFVRKMLDEHQEGRWDWSQQLWALLMLELWQRQYMDSSDLSHPQPSLW
jgi:asparagine synthase (glutamine-hydrolysing)